ncbi:hypothetical protein [Demequina zhanjiangensis]|uniref:Uncharacterized protein n=1 Tax=Demequina zhanjiangensis TaxID=3051659 RepID=A0ABT8G4F3_9MICO|nr:hypothetical protein [Demequina sp. SYSU T00b26]MDN4474029.1 hypothetical protein [Demequina sp. SYSU T00b26]
MSQTGQGAEAPLGEQTSPVKARRRRGPWIVAVVIAAVLATIAVGIGGGFLLFSQAEAAASAAPTSEAPAASPDAPEPTRESVIAENGSVPSYLGTDLDGVAVWNLRNYWGHLSIPDGWADVTAEHLEAQPEDGDWLGGVWALDGGTAAASDALLQVDVFAAGDSASLPIEDAMDGYYLPADRSGLGAMEVGQSPLGYETATVELTGDSTDTLLLLVRCGDSDVTFTLTTPSGGLKPFRAEVEAAAASYRADG